MVGYIIISVYYWTAHLLRFPADSL